MYTVMLVQDDGHGAVGAGSETFNTLKEAQFFAKLKLPDFDSDQDQVFITFRGPSDPCSRTIEWVREPDWWA